MKDYTKANQNKSNDVKLVSLKEIFDGLPPPILIQNFTDNQKTNITINTKKMSEKQKLQAKLEKMVTDHEESHRKLKRQKNEMILLRAKILSMPNRIELRPDEIELISD